MHVCMHNAHRDIDLERPTVLFIFVFSVCMCISLYVIVHACTDLAYSVHHCLLS